jgi:hypothetical protein
MVKKSSKYDKEYVELLESELAIATNIISNLMIYKGFHCDIQYDPTNKTYHGEIFPLLKINVSHNGDVITLKADSALQLESAFHDSVDDYLDWKQEDKERLDWVSQQKRKWRHNK